MFFSGYDCTISSQKMDETGVNGSVHTLHFLHVAVTSQINSLNTHSMRLQLKKEHSRNQKKTHSVNEPKGSFTLCDLFLLLME